ncbi:hypothetical protein GCM10010193_01160 [Kitasatospora atroaurantiaca]|uniref:Pentapeptide repeat protein n=1 Tax=Kitasatospora atroaurantiaca TaxID=285545 RepID=A0A561ELA3_9ACTN|nr:hypothetical protein [Kitasatospora atroaurantiaca]TWE16339.1 hypothetical protein FB465_1319 [Kitasatospora atroaurantiaca]
MRTTIAKITAATALTAFALLAGSGTASAYAHHCPKKHHPQGALAVGGDAVSHDDGSALAVGGDATAWDGDALAVGGDATAWGGSALAVGGDATSHDDKDKDDDC